MIGEAERTSKRLIDTKPGKYDSIKGSFCLKITVSRSCVFVNSWETKILWWIKIREIW